MIVNALEMSDFWHDLAWGKDWASDMLNMRLNGQVWILYVCAFLIEMRLIRREGARERERVCVLVGDLIMVKDDWAWWIDKKDCNGNPSHVKTSHRRQFTRHGVSDFYFLLSTFDSLLSLFFLFFVFYLALLIRYQISPSWFKCLYLIYVRNSTAGSPLL